MILTIVLKAEDAIGLGADLLFEAGMTPDMHEPQIFTARMSGHSDEGVDIIETLLDHGIQPVRVSRTERPYTVINSSFDPMANKPAATKLDLY